jgi:glutathione S-transferase
VKLIIGNKNYSSWSLRPWLLLAAHEIPFEEIRIPLDTATTRAALLTHSEAGKVPVLKDQDLVVWDSLAICEYVSEQYLAGKGWPAEVQARAEARSCCAEMHSGFMALRAALPMNCRALNRSVKQTPELTRDIERIDQLWSGSRGKYAAQGPWLFGEFSIADCMFAPVVFRFRTYGIQTSYPCRQYMQHALASVGMQLWLQQATAETETIDAEEAG